MQIDFIEYLKLAGAFLGSVGGASVVIIGLSKWFGDFMSKRVLDNFNNKHESDLEGIKSKYQTELEKTKSELERAKTKYVRYSEKQFDLYSSLWRILLYTKRQADELWRNADPEKLPAFGEQIRLTKDAINENLLLIEESHYNRLIELINHYENFEFGKTRLTEIRSSQDDIQISHEDARRTINNNREIKENYDNLIFEIGESFRDHIKG